MTRQVKYPTALASTFLWIGFVGAIRFMEAWLKFRAPGITIPLGLGIGRLVFNALNTMEWLFAIVIAANFLLSKNRLFSAGNWAFLVPVTLLVAQTFWLLPLLDARAELYIQGQVAPHSNMHFYYVGAELVKVICLGIFGTKFFGKSGDQEKAINTRLNQHPQRKIFPMLTGGIK